ncbi:MAG: 1-deoxy-D-xylulose-5-phosphate synthase [Planctomycetaceae bacterium]|jgi:1-deoxy-D-xylulose-5-phosphate synthase|nr:1-deoxy-D-xylulose-5-phosphate synthase [Planctomycetaceae bacterium]
MTQNILPTIQSSQDLKSLTKPQLLQLADEIREDLCRLAEQRLVHFASNLGVVELCIALHATFDFTYDRLIWDTGHQIYPHKMLTGRYQQIGTIRTLGGLMGYPNPAESDYDLFVTGHAGCSVGAALGMKCGDELLEKNQYGEKNVAERSAEEKSSRRSVAVIGDGALASGVALEALCHADWLKKNVTVILNDNKMSICPRVGGLGRCLDSLRMHRTYLTLKCEVHRLMQKIPVLGNLFERILGNLKTAIKAGLLGGVLFEELGFRYFGPVDGHNIAQLQRYLKMACEYKEPVLLHVLTEKGRGYQPAMQDPTAYHSPSPEVKKNGKTKIQKTQTPSVSERFLKQIDLSPKEAIIECELNQPSSYTERARDSILRLMTGDRRVCVITAAMCQGNMLEPIREQFPDRFFDVGICESHAIVFAAGLAKAGMRPIVDIYSTFMQRGYDQIFQEISLQKLPVTLMLDRAGIVGADGPTHHGVFDIAYLRPFPNLTIMAPGCAEDVTPMLQFAVSLDSPAAIRYPKAAAPAIGGEFCPIEYGKAEILRRGTDGMIVALGGQLADALTAAQQLETRGVDVGVMNARFAKPLDASTILEPLRRGQFLITVEEGTLAGGFGSAILEAAAEERLDTRLLYRLGIPDEYVEHGERKELLANFGLDVSGIVRRCENVAKYLQRELELL